MKKIERNPLTKPIKDRECMHCEKFFDCNGKESKAACVNYVERKK